MLTIVDTGKLYLLTRKLTTLRTLFIHLYATDTLVANDTTIDDLVEATFPGYLPQLLDSWSPPFLAPQGWARTDHAPVAFQLSDDLVVPARVYGYYITTEAGGGVLVAAERDALGPFEMKTAGAAYIVVPRWTEATAPAGS